MLFYGVAIVKGDTKWLLRWLCLKGELMVEHDAGMAHRYQSIYLFPLILGGKQVEPGQRSAGVIGWIQLSRLGSFSLLARDHRFSSINFSSLFTCECESHRDATCQDCGRPTRCFSVLIIYQLPGKRSTAGSNVTRIAR